MNTRKIAQWLLPLLLLPIFIGCAPQGGEHPEKGASPKDLKRVTLVLDWTPNTNHTGFYVAKDLGFYKEAGFDLEIVQPPEDGAEALVAAGKAQYGIGFQDLMAAAWAKDDPLPITAVCAIVNHNTSGILTAKEKNITRPKDLEGRTYATWDSPIEKAILKNVVETDGGDFSKVNLVPSTVTDAVSALQTDIDALWVYYGWDGIAAEVKKFPTNYFNFIDINPVFDCYSPFLFVNNDYLKNEGASVRAFLDATTKGYDYAIANPKEAAEILCKDNPELDKELVAASQEWLSKQYIADGKRFGEFIPERWNRFYQWLWDEKLIPQPIEKDFGYTNEYLPK